MKKSANYYCQQLKSFSQKSGVEAAMQKTPSRKLWLYDIV